MERPIRPPWDPFRDERLDAFPQPKYASKFNPTPVWSSFEKVIDTINMITTIQKNKKIPSISSKLDIEASFSELRKKITVIFRENLKLEPDSIELFRDPEDGEEKIIVTIPLGPTDDPLEDLLSIKRQLRKIDRNLAENIVVLPSD